MKYNWRNGTKYYKLLLQPDLFGGTNIVCIWGRLGTNNGGYKIILCKSYEEVKNTITSIQKRRKYRGYTASTNMCIES